MTPSDRQALLDSAVASARENRDGSPAAYIPELATVDPERIAAAIVGPEGTVSAGDTGHRFTLQSSAKLALLCGLLEERGPDAVFSVVGTEPTGGSFASVAELEWRGPKPGNPLINAGAIALCAQLGGDLEGRLGWIEHWAERLYGGKPTINQRVQVSERRTGHRNRAIAHVLKGASMLSGPVDDVLEMYFALCSLEATVVEAARLPAILAAGGISPDGERVLSARTASTVVAIMATCGMYDESGAHLVATGLPAKSGVSGVIVAVAPGRAGIAVFSPRINAKGGSVRGHQMLSHLSGALGWHFALPVAS